MTDTVYVAARLGGYMQGIVGVYTTRDLAEAAIDEAKKAEKGNFHSFSIAHVRLNVIPELGEYLGIAGRVVNSDAWEPMFKGTAGLPWRKQC